MDKYYKSISEEEWQQIEDEDDAYDYAHCGPGILVGGLGGGNKTSITDI